MEKKDKDKLRAQVRALATERKEAPPKACDTLTVATITNGQAAEAGHLGRMLESLAGLNCAVVLVDTSSEASPAVAELAAKHGAQLAHQPWAQDFADARNAATRLVQTPWMLVLDSDETLKVEGEALFNALASTHADAFSIMLHNVRETGQVSHPIVRLYRMSAGVVWKSRLHEYVVNIHSNKSKLGGTVPGVAIYHAGHSEADAARFDKVARNKEISLLEWSENPADTYACFIRATCLADEMVPAAKLWQQVLADFERAPLLMLTQGWRRHACAQMVAFYDAVAQGYEAAGLHGNKGAQGAWAKLAEMAGRARRMLPGFEDLADFGSPDLRYYAGKAALNLGDPALALDVLAPLMGSPTVLPYANNEAAFTGRFLVYLQALLEVGRFAEVSELGAGLLPNYGEGGHFKHDPTREATLKRLNDLVVSAREKQEEANTFLADYLGKH